MFVCWFRFNPPFLLILHLLDPDPMQIQIRNNGSYTKNKRVLFPNFFSLTIFMRF
jgi:hypothetical protein